MTVDLRDILSPGLMAQMEQTPQDPVWHGEGDVLTHTKLVCGAMKALPAWQNADATTQKALFLAAALHDIGKIRTTFQEDGRWVSPGHARTGAGMARQILWQDFDLCGTPEKQRLREAVCNLIRYHGLPPHAIDEPDGLLRLRKAAANGELSPMFTIDHLCILSKADIRGRICPDQEELLDKVWLCRELAAEGSVLGAPYPFPSGHTGYSYLSGKNAAPDYPLYDDTWGEVVLLSGLPGTGKDTWIRENLDLPMISLDELRRELGVSPTGDQGRVAEAATGRAKELLRAKQPFVWNATNITPQTRGRLVNLFTAYGASVKIVYLETGWAELLRRNAGRRDSVPESAVCSMLEKLSPPERWEAHQVQWLCV